MKKQIISAAIAAAAAISPLTSFAGEYYGDITLPDLTYSEIDGTPISEADFDAAMTAAETAAAQRMVFAFTKALKKLSELDDQERVSITVAALNSSGHNTPENNAAEAEIRKNYLSHYQRETELVRKYANDKDYRSLLIDWRGEKDFYDMSGDMYTDRFFELIKQEQELIEEYHNNRAMDVPYTDEDGTVYTLGSLNTDYENSYSSMTDEEQEQFARITHNAMQNTLEKESDIFLRMVRVRDEMGREAGYDNYYDFASNELYLRDYSSSEVKIFRDAVKEYIVPLSGYEDSVSYDSVIEGMTNSEITALVGKGMNELEPELGETFDYMVSRGFLDVCENPDRSSPGNAFTAPIGRLPAAAVFLSTVDNMKDFTFSSLVHEFGHYNSLLHYNLDTLAKTGKTAEDGTVSIDIQEIYSQGLELLFTKLYPEMMTLRSVSASEVNMISSMLYSITTGCLFDEWQYEVYTHPDISAEELNELYYSIADSYGVDGGSFPWFLVEHNFDSPVYYLGYAVSAGAALDIWAQSRIDYDGALDRYMRLTTKEEKDFKALLTDSGFDNIFERDTIKNIAGRIIDFYTADYMDITLDNWYTENARVTRPFFDSTADETRFRPSDPMTRLETANTLGKFNEYTTSVTYTGTSAFNDASTSYAAWTADAGVIKGYDENTLGAADTLTREQAVTMLSRYAEHEKLSIGLLANSSDMEDFSDNGDISDWARESFDWAISTGMIYGIPTGDGQLLAPQETLTRAQFAAMLTRLITYSGIRLK